MSIRYECAAFVHRLHPYRAASRLGGVSPQRIPLHITETEHRWSGTHSGGSQCMAAMLAICTLGLALMRLFCHSGLPACTPVEE